MPSEDGKKALEREAIEQPDSLLLDGAKKKRRAGNAANNVDGFSGAYT